MARRKSDDPTEAELEILKVLWKLKEATVRDVHEALGGKSGYTTVLKFMQIMQEKKLITRMGEKRPHRYKAAVAQQKTEKKIIGGWIDKIASGSAAEMAMKALGARSVSKSEIQELRDLLDELEKGDEDA